MISTYIHQNWIPVDEGYPNCEGLLDDYEGFRVLARGAAEGSNMYRVSFESVIAYSSIEESSSFNDKRRAPGLIHEGCFFKVESSWYMAELHEISSGVREGDDIHHYALYFANQCIDVLAYGHPRVENLNE